MSLFENYTIIAYRLGGTNTSWETSDNDNIFYVKKEDLPKLITAILKLHHTPGKNPYSNHSTAKVQLISLIDPNHPIRSWWTSPTLGLPQLDNDTFSKDPITIIDALPHKCGKIIYASSAIYADYVVQTVERDGDEDEKEEPKKVMIHSYIDPEYRTLVDISDEATTTISIMTHGFRDTEFSYVI